MKQRGFLEPAEKDELELAVEANHKAYELLKEYIRLNYKDILGQKKLCFDLIERFKQDPSIKYMLKDILVEIGQLQDMETAGKTSHL